VVRDQPPVFLKPEEIQVNTFEKEAILKIWKIGGLFYYFRFAEIVPAIDSANKICQNFAVAGIFFFFLESNH
jgi:hypothetical protein